MAAKCKTACEVKHYLHTNVYHPKKQRIISFIQVSKTEPSKNPLKKKDNIHYLCLSVNAGKPYEPSLARYIRSDDDDNFVLRRQWSLTALTKVDGKQSTSSGAFELWFDLPFKFMAQNSQEKEKFIEDIADTIKKFVNREPPVFINVNSKSKDVIIKVADERSQLEKTHQELAERGQKLTEVEKATSEMAASSEKFSENARKLAEQYQ